ncbi:MAG: hypothetical protein LV473_22990, partial [Nitrospira sp.]|nr:hypothetical protein [Nitrospira sp.]
PATATGENGSTHNDATEILYAVTVGGHFMLLVLHGISATNSVPTRIQPCRNGLPKPCSLLG